jgi:hypothetical protein
MPSQKRARSTSAEATTTTWPCSVCTLENPISSRRCQACYNRRLLRGNAKIVQVLQSVELSSTPASAADQQFSSSMECKLSSSSNNKQAHKDLHEDPTPTPCITQWLQNRKKRKRKSNAINVSVIVNDQRLEPVLVAVCKYQPIAATAAAEFEAMNDSANVNHTDTIDVITNRAITDTYEAASVATSISHSLQVSTTRDNNTFDLEQPTMKSPINISVRVNRKVLEPLLVAVFEEKHSPCHEQSSTEEEPYDIAADQDVSQQNHAKPPVALCIQHILAVADSLEHDVHSSNLYLPVDSFATNAAFKSKQSTHAAAVQEITFFDEPNENSFNAANPTDQSCPKICPAATDDAPSGDISHLDCASILVSFAAKCGNETAFRTNSNILREDEAHPFDTCSSEPVEDSSLRNDSNNVSEHLPVDGHEDDCYDVEPRESSSDCKSRGGFFYTQVSQASQDASQEAILNHDNDQTVISGSQVDSHEELDRSLTNNHEPSELSSKDTQLEIIRANASDVPFDSSLASCKQDAQITASGTIIGDADAIYGGESGVHNASVSTAQETPICLCDNDQGHPTTLLVDSVQSYYSTAESGVAPLFTTASGKPIKVLDAGLAHAQSLWNGTGLALCATDKPSIALPSQEVTQTSALDPVGPVLHAVSADYPFVALPASPASYDFSETNERCMAAENSSSTFSLDVSDENTIDLGQIRNAKPSARLAMFTTASGSAVYITDEALVRAGNLLEGTGSRSNLSASSGLAMDTCGHSVEYNNELVSLNASAVASFTTARGSAVQISQAGLARAKEIWAPRSNANDMLPSTKDLTSEYLGFTTAKGSCIKVSDAELARANELWTKSCLPPAARATLNEAKSVAISGRTTTCTEMDVSIVQTKEVYTRLGSDVEHSFATVNASVNSDSIDADRRVSVDSVFATANDDNFPSVDASKPSLNRFVDREGDTRKDHDSQPFNRVSIGTPGCFTPFQLHSSAKADSMLKESNTESSAPEKLGVPRVLRGGDLVPRRRNSNASKRVSFENCPSRVIFHASVFDSPIPLNDNVDTQAAEVVPKSTDSSKRPERRTCAEATLSEIISTPAALTTSGNGSGDTPSEMSITRDSDEFNDLEGFSFPTFSTGMGKTIKISSAAFAKAASIFDDSVHPSTTTPDVEDNAVVFEDAKETTLTTPVTDALAPKPFSFGFTTGMGNIIKISDADVLKAEGILNPATATEASISDQPSFLTAKLGQNVQCTESNLAEAKSFLGDDKVAHDIAYRSSANECDGMEQTAPHVVESIKTFGKSSSQTSTFQNYAIPPYSLAEADRNGYFTNDWYACLQHGVSVDVLSVTSTNALELRFNIDTKRPNFYPIRNSTTLGEIRDFRSAMEDKGCNCVLISDKWIESHVRWVVWKLACRERRFSPWIGGLYLTFDRVVEQLCLRHKKEITGGSRPPLRKVLNRDVSASSTMILCIAQIRWPGDKDAKCLLELTDGWYSLRASTDPQLSSLVLAGKISVGSKIIVSNSTLVGAEDGVDPTDATFDPFSDESPTLRIYANAVRLAKWDAKLGFVRPSRNCPGALLVSRISAVLEGGGTIPVIDVVVVKTYPLLYLEKAEESSSRSRILTETEEARRALSFEKMRQKLVEECSEEIEAECLKDVDEGAPELWHRMRDHDSPNEMYERFSRDEKRAIDQWNDRRAHLLQKGIQGEMEARLEEHNAVFVPGTPFIKLQVRSDISSEQLGSDLSVANEEASLTIWSPSEEQLGLLKDGCTLRLRSLSVKDIRFGGLLQLSGNGHTPISDLFHRNHDPSQHPTPEQSAHEITSLVRMHLLSRAMEQLAEEELQIQMVDVVGCVLKVHQYVDPPLTHIHFTDFSGLLMRIEAGSENTKLQIFGDCAPILDDTHGPAVLFSFRDLIVAPFDKINRCAVAHFGEDSSVSLHRDFNNSVLNKLIHSPMGKLRAQIMAYAIDANLPLMQNSDADEAIAVGFIAGFEVLSSQTLYIDVDCGGTTLHKWKLPLDLVNALLRCADFSKEKIVFGAEQELRLSQLSSIGRIFRNQHVRFGFHVQRIVDTENEPFASCLFEVTDVFSENDDALSNLYRARYALQYV